MDLPTPSSPHPSQLVLHPDFVSSTYGGLNIVPHMTLPDPLPSISGDFSTHHLAHDNSMPPFPSPHTLSIVDSSMTVISEEQDSSNETKKKQKRKREKDEKASPKIEKKIGRKKQIESYSQSHQSRIRDQLHKKLIEVAGGEDKVLPLLQNYFYSHEEGKKLFEKLHPPEQEVQRFYNLIPVFQNHCTKANKKLFIRLLRQSNFTKSQAESALGVTICNDTWKKAAIPEESSPDKRRKINEGAANTIVDWIINNTQPSKKTTQTKSESGEMETVTVRYVECCYRHLFERFVQAIELKMLILPGVESISETSFRKLIPKYVKLPKKKIDCGNGLSQSQSISTVSTLQPTFQTIISPFPNLPQMNQVQLPNHTQIQIHNSDPNLLT
jgi:hypothetical protein